MKFMRCNEGAADRSRNDNLVGCYGGRSAPANALGRGPSVNSPRQFEPQDGIPWELGIPGRDLPLLIGLGQAGA